MVDFFIPMNVLHWGLVPPFRGLFKIRDVDKYSSTFPFFFRDFEEIVVLTL